MSEGISSTSFAMHLCALGVAIARQPASSTWKQCTKRKSGCAQSAHEHRLELVDPLLFRRMTGRETGKEEDGGELVHDRRLSRTDPSAMGGSLAARVWGDATSGRSSLASCPSRRAGSLARRSSRRSRRRHRGRAR